MGESIFKKIKKIIKYAVIALAVFVFAFSDFISVLPLGLQNSKMAENFRVHEAQAATTGEKYPTLGETISESPWSDNGWTTPINIYSDDAATANITAASYDSGDQTHVLKATGFDFSAIPDGSTIDGIIVRVNSWYRSGQGSGSMDLCQLLDVSKAKVGTNQCAAAVALTTNNATVITKGSAVDNWGNALTTAWIKSANFGVAVGIIATAANADVDVDYVSVEVFYTPLAGTDATSYSNIIESGLNDLGARSGQQITVSSTGANFGTVSAGAGRGNCAGGAGTGCVKIGTYTVPSGSISAWDPDIITFTLPADASGYAGIYGGTGLDGLVVTAAGVADTTPLTFYVYPNITQITDLSDLAITEAQIGQVIKIKGNHFGTNGVSSELMINGVAVAIIPADWSEILLSNAQFPGQTGIINGTIKVTRNSDSRTTQINFNTKALSVTSSSSSPVENDQTGVMIHFNGSGIDTDTTGSNIRPVFYLKKTGQTPILGDNTGANYGITANYQDVYATFDLTGANAIAGAWDLELANMDGSVSTCSSCLTIENRFIVNSIVPGYGINLGIKTVDSVGGFGFKDGATVKLNNGIDILPSTAFTFTDLSTLSNGAFDLTGAALGAWDVVVTNPGPITATFSGGFDVRSSEPSVPTNISQSKTQAGVEVLVGEGIGGQTDIYFRMDMEGGLTGRYYPQVEVQPNGAAFECDNDSLDSCVSSLNGFFAENSTDIFSYDGITPVQGWVNISGVDGTSYHWQARVRNSVGRSNWISFGSADPSEIGEVDFYIDITSPVIRLGTDDTCMTAAPLASVTDLSAIVQWDTSDVTSGAVTPPGSGSYAKGQVDYKKGAEAWAVTTLSAWENSPHSITLSGLTPATTYTFRIRAQDYAGNENTSPECTFLTTSSRPIKTVEFFIGQENLQVITEQVRKHFSVLIPEGRSAPETDISIKSAFIEITGISSDGSQTINVGLRRGDQAIPPVGDDYAIDSTGTTTPFTIFFDALAPQGAGQDNMSNIVSGNNDNLYDYTLFLRGNGSVAVSAFSAKLILTYSYAQ